MLLGGNVTVREGDNVGGDFKKVPGCETPKQIGCALAFSAFNAPVPADARFGRPGERDHPRRSRDRRRPLHQPRRPRRRPRAAATVYPTEPFAPGTTIGTATEAVGIPRPAVTTPWSSPDAYSGECSSADDADVLQIARWAAPRC